MLKRKQRLFISFSVIVFALFAQEVTNVASAQQNSLNAQFPITVSDNHRYLVDQKKHPFFYQADTPWDIFYIWTKPEVDEYLEDRKNKGFNVIQVQLLVDNYALKNRDNQHPLNGTLDLENRNEAFFSNVDWVLHKAAEKGIAVMIAPAWLSCCVPGWHKGLKENGMAKAKAFGRFLGARYNYKDFPNILGWIHGGDSDPGTELDEVKAIAEGIQETEGKPRLHTAHWSSPNSTRAITEGVPWLNLNATYTYSSDRNDVGKGQYQIYAASINDYLRTPAQPFFLVESEYEVPDAANQAVSKPEILRRQAYWAVLSGATGFTYGSANCCGFRADWREILHLPAAQQMKYVNDLFTRLPWYKLVPDGLPDPKQKINHKCIREGYGTYYDKAGNAPDEGINYITCAATPDGRLLVAYVPSTGTTPRSFTVGINKVKGNTTAQWYNPVDGTFHAAAKKIAAAKGIVTFTTPGDNGTGTNDWLLLIKGSKSDMGL